VSELFVWPTAVYLSLYSSNPYSLRSFYLLHSLTHRSDPDTINRFLSFQAVLDSEKVKFVEASRSGALELVEVSDNFLELYGCILNDEKLDDAAKGQFLVIDDALASRPELSHFYTHLDTAKVILLQAVNKKFGAELKSTFAKLCIDSTLMNRGLKFACFLGLKSGTKQSLVGSLKGADELQAARKGCADLIAPLMKSEFMSDKAFALRQLIELGGEESVVALNEAKEKWTKHTIGCETYISTVASADTNEVCNHIKGLMKEPFFNIALAGHARTVARGWCSTRKRALLSKEGLKLTVELFAVIGKVNEMSAYSFISAFDEANKFDTGIKLMLKKAVDDMRNGLDAVKQESLYNQLGRLLKGFD
jgi:hypothetical protein